MNRGSTKRSRQVERNRATRRMMIIFAAVLFVCMFAQIFMISRLAKQNKEIRAVESRIKALNADAENYRLALNQLGNTDRVSKRAAALGMIEPGEKQIRVVNLPDIVDNTSAQSAGNTSAEEMNQ